MHEYMNCYLWQLGVDGVDLLSSSSTAWVFYNRVKFKLIYDDVQQSQRAQRKKAAEVSSVSSNTNVTLHTMGTF